MNKLKITPKDFQIIDLVPALSGLIGKTALVTSFALIWASSLNITRPDFVFENVRIEMIIGSIITLLAALFLQGTAPTGTLAPLVVLVPAMAAFGVHPFILSIMVGIIGIISIRSKLFHHLIKLSGDICKISIALTIGIAGVLLSLKSLLSYFGEQRIPLLILIITLSAVYILLRHWNKIWLIIPIASGISLLISVLFQFPIGTVEEIRIPSFNPVYWWNNMWGIGFGFDLITILKTLPFAIFILLLWAVDTVSITTMLEANDQRGERKQEININNSFIITSLRNIIGGIIGGAQTSALWRSFLIPLFMVKRPMRPASILLGGLGILAGFTAIPIKLLSYPPMIWSVLLFGIFLPFIIVGLRNLLSIKTLSDRLIILLLIIGGVIISPILTWIGAIAYERVSNRLKKK